eukprot:TRINITY_DN8164_c0_g1_i1.p1 TRINITY_DN8164_c0_g1~~TRINITY_DN8164_c0_g1_i1.p1  ORF type:complete len:980 (+),score=304.92 TRINITY_DN8164_c0_g1_i1:1-2940(+)
MFSVDRTRPPLANLNPSDPYSTSGRNAFNVISLIERIDKNIPLKIEAMDSYEFYNREGQFETELWVGTSEGVLIRYSLKYDAGKKRDSLMMMESLMFSKKAIQQITVVEEFSCILLLCDNEISIHELPSFKAQHSHIPRTRGCHMFSVDRTRPPLANLNPSDPYSTSGRNAFNVISLIERIDKNIPLKIEAMDSYEFYNREGQFETELWVGTSEGVLIRYSLKYDAGKKRDSLMMMESLMFSKKAIQQITVVEEFSCILLLCDNEISIHELPSFKAQHSHIPRTRGCHMFSVDRTRSTLQFCCAIKKKLIIFEIANDMIQERKELVLPDVPKTVMWCGINICVGFKKGYNMIQIGNGALQELFSSGKSGSSLIGLYTKENQLLLVKDTLGIFVGFDGRPARGYAINWTEIPTSLSFSFPYCLAIVPRGLEIRTFFQRNQNDQADGMVQVLALPRAKVIASKRSIFVASVNYIWMLSPVPVNLQIDQLVKEASFEEAIALCETMTTDDLGKEERIKKIKVEYGYHLFGLGQYGKSFETLAQLKCDPLQVIGLFPEFLPANLRSKFTYPQDVRDRSANAGSNPEALGNLVDYLTDIRAKYTNSSAPIQNPTSIAEISEYSNSTDLAEIVDTCLLRAYVRQNGSFVAPLLRQPNRCHVLECKRILLDTKKYSELALLFRSKNLHRSILELLKQLGEGKPDAATNPGLIETVKYLKTLNRDNTEIILEFSAWVLQASARLGLTIFTESMEDSEESSLDPNLVLNHIETYAPVATTAYLEYLVFKRNLTDEEFHNGLVVQYLARLQALSKRPKENPESNTPQEMAQLAAYRKALFNLLEGSQYYKPEKMLGRFPRDELYQERAILLSRLGKHDLALDLYVYKLKNISLSEEYCNKNYNENGPEEAKRVYLTLFTIFLKPSDPTIQPLYNAAFSLLKKYYNKIDTRIGRSILGKTPSALQETQGESGIQHPTRNGPTRGLQKGFV